jgi:hypothetical protein
LCVASLDSFLAPGVGGKESRMARLHSQDLRERLLRAYDRGMKTNKPQ